MRNAGFSVLSQDLLQNLRRPYGPQPEHPSNNAFLPFDPRKASHINEVPILIGYTNSEGIFSVLFNKLKNLEPIHTNFENRIPPDFNLEFGSIESKEIAHKIKKFYYRDTEPSLDTSDAFIKVSNRDRRF